MLETVTCMTVHFRIGAVVSDVRDEHVIGLILGNDGVFFVGSMKMTGGLHVL